MLGHRLRRWPSIKTAPDQLHPLLKDHRTQTLFVIFMSGRSNVRMRKRPLDEMINKQRDDTRLSDTGGSGYTID